MPHSSDNSQQTNKPLTAALRFVAGLVVPVLLIVVFYVLVLPAGLLMRAFGKDPMMRKLDSSRQSYRSASTPAAKDKLEKQY